MIRKRKLIVFTLCGITIFIILTLFCMNVLTNWEYNRHGYLNNNLENKIWAHYYKLPEKYMLTHGNEDNRTNLFIRNLQTDYHMNLPELWRYVNSIVSKDTLYPQTEHLGLAVNAMKSTKIIKADLDRRGTQLKLLLTLEGGQRVIFKPKWYEIDKVIEGPIYAGKDRFGSEILAFYLSAILHKPFVPISVIRKISIKEDIVPVATNNLLSTLFYHKNLTCIYGKCFYCKKEDPICCDNNGILAGAIIFNLDVDLKNHRSPWQRTYKSDKKALWQIKNNYCIAVKSKFSKSRLYDLIDTAIFDFLIQNGDRHHYETYQDKIIFLDNGKGLGNPHINYLDVLAPLYQCCLLRKNTWERLLELSGGKLRQLIISMPDVNEIVTEDHVNAIDKRLLFIYATVEYCRNRES